MAVIKFTGLNNRLRPDEFPISQNGPDLGRCWKAIDVNFTNTGEVMLPCIGTTSVHAGNVTSLFVGLNGTFFVEGGSLWLLDGLVELASSVGSNKFYYTEVGSTTYFSNGTVRGRFIKGESSAREWGTAVPTQPTCTPITTGGMTAGDYRVAITWIAGEESGTGNSTKVTVEEGGGIALSSFPAAPSYVTGVAVWVTQCNGKDLYLYGEYDISTTSLNLERKKGTIVLDTQFGYPPTPSSTILAHFGRIYYISGSLVYYTHIGLQGPRYGLQMAHNFFPFDSDVQTIVSVPGFLYVGTERSISQIANIDGDAPAVCEVIKDCGSVKGSECYDTNGDAYFMTKRGFVKATPEGLQELSYDSVAIPFYTYGTMTITEVAGNKYLHFFGTGETKNSLANAQWNTEDGTGTGWAINLTTGAVNKYESLDFNNVSNGYGCSSGGISLLSGNSTIVGTVESGKHDFGDSKEKRIPEAYVLVDGGKTTLTVTTDNSAIPYQLRLTDIQENVRVNLAKGAKGRFWQFKLQNKLGQTAVISELEPIVVVTQRY